MMHNPTSQRGAALPAILAVLCGLAGLALGPGQIVYCMFFSGSAAGDHPCEPGKPLTIALDPEQNPLRFLAKIEYKKPRYIFHRAVTSYDSTLSLAGEQVWRHQIRVSEADDDDDRSSFAIGSTYTTTAIALFSVDEKGDYTFVAQPTSDDDIKVRSLTIRVRENVRVVATGIAATGFGLMVLVFVLLVIAVRSKRSAPNDAERSTA